MATKIYISESDKNKAAVTLATYSFVITSEILCNYGNDVWDKFRTQYTYLYKQKAKKTINQIKEALDEYDYKVKQIIMFDKNDNSAYQYFADILDFYEDLLASDIQKLEFTIDKHFLKANIKDHIPLSKAETLRTLSELLKYTIKYRVKELKTLNLKLEDGHTYDPQRAANAFESKAVGKLSNDFVELIYKTTHHKGTINLQSAPDCHLAVKVLERKLCDADILTQAIEYAEEQETLR